MQVIDGKTIRNRRRELNMTLEECCEGICSLSYLSMIENGRRALTADLLDKFTARLGLNELNAHSRFSQEALFTSGIIAIRSDHLNEADQILQEIPESNFKTTLDALLQEKRGQTTASISLLRRVLAQDPEPLLFLLVANALVRQLFQQGEIESVFEVGEFALRRVTADRRPVDDALIELKANLAHAYAQVGNVTRGIELTRSAPRPPAAKWGDVVENWSKASVLMRAGDMTAAATAFRDAYDQMNAFDRPIAKARLLKSAVYCEIQSGKVEEQKQLSDLDYAVDVFSASQLEFDVLEIGFTRALLESKLGRLDRCKTSAIAVQERIKDFNSVESAILAANLCLLMHELELQESGADLLAWAQGVLDVAPDKRINAMAWNRLADAYEKYGDNAAAYLAMKKSVTFAGVSASTISLLSLD